MAIKLITIDLDGTLLNDKKQVSERNRAAIMAAEDMGVMVTVSRRYGDMRGWPAYAAAR